MGNYSGGITIGTFQVVVTARDFSKVEQSDCFVNEAWYSTPQ
jgi:hypothetical protein